MGFSIASGTVIGPHHRHRAEPNQDALAVVEEEGYVLIAAADGAGSLELSHLGAALAVEEALGATRALLEEGSLPAAALEVGLQQARESLLEQEQASLMGCTLALAYLAEDAWAAAVVGDAFAVVSRTDGTHELIQPPSHSEYANVTHLLTSKTYEPLIVSHSETVAGVSVASDGLEHATVQQGVPTAGFWTPVVKRTAGGKLSAQALLEHMDGQERLDDDTTLVVAALKEA